MERFVVEPETHTKYLFHVYDTKRRKRSAWWSSKECAQEAADVYNQAAAAGLRVKMPRRW